MFWFIISTTLVFLKVWITWYLHPNYDLVLSRFLDAQGRESLNLKPMSLTFKGLDEWKPLCFEHFGCIPPTQHLPTRELTTPLPRACALSVAHTNPLPFMTFSPEVFNTIASIPNHLLAIDAMKYTQNKHRIGWTLWLSGRVHAYCLSMTFWILSDSKFIRRNNFLPTRFSIWNLSRLLEKTNMAEHTFVFKL